MNNATALVVEDDKNTSFAYSKMLETMGFSVQLAHSLNQAKMHVEKLNPSVVLLDIGLPDGNGLELLKRYADKSELKPKFVVVTGDSSQDLAVNCLRARADDFLSKPVSLKKLRGCISQLQASSESANEAVLDRNHAIPLHELEQTVVFKGSSMVAHELREAVSCCANSGMNAVISGAVGVEKSSVAYAVHRQSHTPGQFVCVFGSDITPPLAAPDAHQSVEPTKRNSDDNLLSQLQAARGGVFVISDICSLPATGQATLCSYLRRNSSNASGSKSSGRAKIIATIHEDWQKAVTEGRLNQELYHRLAEFVINVPGLKDRARDIPDMAEAILEDLNRSQKTVKCFAEGSLSHLENYHWPGNIRELNNVIRQGFAGRSTTISITRDLAFSRSQLQTESSCVDSLIGKTFWETEKALLFATLDSVAGDKTRAAEMLGISLKTLYNRLKAYS